MLTSPAYTPKLRRYLAAQRDRNGLILHDPRQVGHPIHLSPAAFELVKLFDGTITLGELASAAQLAIADVAALVQGLDTAL
ncbi:MAG: hypothetical protein MUF18_19710, partial [Fimbriiglobus sp.]|nr:hypothetical protein [Fimbriiglobus sp.]